MSHSGSNNISGESSEEAGQGKSSFCQNRVKGSLLQRCNKKANRSAAENSQSGWAHLQQELCSAATNTKGRAGISIPAHQSHCCLAAPDSHLCDAPPQERAQRNQLQTAHVTQTEPYTLFLAGRSNAPPHHGVPPRPDTFSFALAYSTTTVSQRFLLCPHRHTHR